MNEQRLFAGYSLLFCLAFSACGEPDETAWIERRPALVQPVPAAPSSDRPEQNSEPDDARPDEPGDARSDDPEPAEPAEPAEPRNRCDDGERYPVPDWPSETATQHGLDRNALERAADYAGANHSRCLLVVRHGAVVGEWYWGRNMGRRMDRDNRIKSWSVGKSYAATVTGIAIDQGLINSVDDSIADYIPNFAGSRKEQISIRDLLSMSSGLRFDLTADNLGMFFAGDMTRKALRNPVTNEPGLLWEYNNHTVQLIEPILRQATGMAADEFAQTQLFEKLGMNASWQRDRRDQPAMYMNVSASCRDHAKFAYMMMRKGCWDGEEVLSEAYRDEAISPSTEMNKGYGFWWWMNAETPTLNSVDFSEYDGVLQPFAPADAFMAIGLGNQVIEAIPSLDMVIVRMGVAPQENLLYWLTDRPRIMREMKSDGDHVVLNGVVSRVLSAVRD
jgi:CubicO group peptidase (beta-lactamase class C family)